MPGRLKRLAAEGAGGPAGRHEGRDAANEVSSARRFNAHPQEIRGGRLRAGQVGRRLVLADRLSFDHDLGRGRIPGQRHGADPEQLDGGFLQRLVVPRNASRKLAREPLHRVEQLGHATGEGRHLRLLQPDADDGAALSGLQVEGSCAGLAEGAGDEPVRSVEIKDATGHRAHRIWNRLARVEREMGNRIGRPRFGARRPGTAQAQPITPGRRPGPGPRTRIWLSWAAAALGVAVVAFLVGRAGSDARLPSPTPSPSASAPLPIRFGTALDSAGGEAINPTTRFRADDRIAYSVQLAAAPGVDTILVEIVRIEDGTIVQRPSTQGIVASATIVSFRFAVPTGQLLDDWGAGAYEMRIFLPGAAHPIAAGRFTLVETPVAS
jgi:hypothetical protein